MLDAYRAAADEGGQGAAMVDGEMIDEANRKMAERVVQAGHAAGYAA
jgi:citrate lyase subunit beta/citryl-CoA lyase